MGRMLSVPLPWAIAGTLALLASLAGNALQWRAAAVAEAEHAAAMGRAVLDGELAVQRLVQGQTASIALLRSEDEAELLRVQASLAAVAGQRLTVYRDRIRTVEVPVCTVSQAQIDALNEVLR